MLLTGKLPLQVTAPTRRSMRCQEVTFQLLNIAQEIGNASACEKNLVNLRLFTRYPFMLAQRKSRRPELGAGVINHIPNLPPPLGKTLPKYW